MEMIVRYGQIVNYEHRDIILAQGKIGHGLLVILRGKTMVTVKLLSRGEIELADLVEGQFFGEVNLLENAACTATVRSIRKASCFLLQTSVFDMLHIAFPMIHYQINRALIENVLLRQAHLVKEIKMLSKKSHRHVVHLSAKKVSSVAAKKIALSPAEKRKRFAYLGALPIFNSVLNEDEMAYFVSMTQLIDVQHHHTFVSQRDQAASYFFILKGSMTIGIPTTKGTIKFAVFGPNSLLCSTSFFDQQSSLFTYETRGSASLLVLSQEALLLIKKRHSSLWYKLHDLGCRYIVSLQKRLNTQVVRASSETPESKINLST